MMNTETRDKNGAVPLPATSGPRPYRCDICQRSFREVATLRKHEQLHRADRPYICTTCGKSFLWSSNLKVHERVHTGERPYKCKICHRCFTQSNDLRRHERNVHMRGKLYSYKTPAGRPVPPAAPNPGQMNLAAYQAFALQQRAILQHALTYESLMQNSVAMTTASHYLQHTGRSLSSLPAMNDNDVSTVSTSASNAHSNHDKHEELHLPHNGDRPLKLEQVTPPPGERSQYERQNHNSEDNHSPGQSRYSPASNKAHSPPTMSTTSPYASMNGHNGTQLESPEGKKDDRPYSHESHASEYPKFFNYPEQHGLQRSYHSAFNSMHNHSDSVMDLRVNKSLSSVESEDGELDWKARHSSTLSSKSPDSESESDSKRDVTTTSYTPTVDSGIHHCHHCNIFFHDFTMYNLHQSLHSPVDEDPFMCPSCLKRCQDRIEFMFHIVWHVKYPHTIPKYQSFKESYMITEPDDNEEIDHNDD
ncbi:ikaros family zinc finger protein-like [Mercenaria mercenaria]|uniref:ikaros family zinc finger protein-like n=1 Tax=Mercenaria mercenaria TaxID=6596 RepID=UPI00234F2693|nr:ikaros family zinc finger protein-like [Mercenaria mercenaria]